MVRWMQFLPIIFLLGLSACQQQTSPAGLANPASVHCEEQGYTLEIREDADGGQYGVCIFPDGSECEEWAFFRGECGPSPTDEVKTEDFGEITIEGVQVHSGNSIAFTGRSTLPEGTCLQTELVADGERESWWPVEDCVPVGGDGTWTIVVPLGEGGAPDELDPTVQYELRAWQQSDPTMQAVFWFDLAGPPAPEE